MLQRLWISLFFVTFLFNFAIRTAMDAKPTDLCLLPKKIYHLSLTKITPRIDEGNIAQHYCHLWYSIHETKSRERYLFYAVVRSSVRRLLLPWHRHALGPKEETKPFVRRISQIMQNGYCEFSHRSVVMHKRAEKVIKPTVLGPISYSWRGSRCQSEKTL